MLNKTILLGAIVASLLYCAPAGAQLVIQPVINVGGPQPYFAGEPYVNNYDPHHRWHDRHYWHDHHDHGGHDGHRR